MSTPPHRMRLVLSLMLCFGASCAQAPSEEGAEPDDFDEVVPPHTAVLDAGHAADDPRDAAAAQLDAPTSPLTDGASAGDASADEPSTDARTSEPARPDAEDVDASVSDSDAGHDVDDVDDGDDAGDGAGVDSDAGDADENDDGDDAGSDEEEPLDAGPPVDAGPSIPDAASPPDSRVPPEEEPCPPGVYAGAFAGEISALLGFVRIDISGIISVEIAAPSGGSQADLLPIRNGELEGTDQDGNPIRAVVTGTLNCATRKLDNGRITEGEYRRPDPLVPFAPPTTTRFSGTLTATYRDDPPSAQGRWEVENESGRRGGTGSWSVALRR